MVPAQSGLQPAQRPEDVVGAYERGPVDEAHLHAAVLVHVRGPDGRARVEGPLPLAGDAAHLDGPGREQLVDRVLYSSTVEEQGDSIVIRIERGERNG